MYFLDILLLCMYLFLCLLFCFGSWVDGFVVIYQKIIYYFYKIYENLKKKVLRMLIEKNCF